MDTVVSPGPRFGSVTIPSSKSIVHRLLICAALGKSPVSISVNGLSKDILATANCLRALGAEIEVRESRLDVRPIGSPEENAVLLCGESGSTLRFLLPVIGALGASGCFVMEGRLPERPMQEYEALLTAHGMHLRREENRLFCEGRLKEGNYTLPGNISSQYFSGLLMALPLLSGNSELSVQGRLESADYIHLTEDALAEAGIIIHNYPGSWTIPGSQTPCLPPSLTAEGDWSNAAFFLCAGALSEEGISVKGLNCHSRQGDRTVLQLLESFGAEARTVPEENRVFVRKKACRPLEIDASFIPDLIPVLSVLSCAAEGDTHIVNAARLRMKESDRLTSTAKLIAALGGTAEEKEDSLVIHGRRFLLGGTADSCHDHRIAMSAAVAASICREEVHVTGAECVEKSYPDFWDDWKECTP
jgi:3-phosphoshikimate 1-carboxyvinyltransferase